MRPSHEHLAHRYRRRQLRLRRRYLWSRLQVTLTQAGHLVVELLKLYVMEVVAQGWLHPLGTAGLVATSIIILVIFFTHGE